MGLAHDFQDDLDAIALIPAVPTILDVICLSTGMRFAAIARVRQDRWVACSVRDNIAFGLQAGEELKVETTICSAIRETRQAVAIDNVADDACYGGHPTPAMYGFQSYISMPITLPDGSIFGTLCAIDPRPARVNTPETIGMFKLFAELIAFHLDAARKLSATHANLLDERRTSELREQFIAVLGHDLRNPLAAVGSGIELIARTPLDDKARRLVPMVKTSLSRMAGLIDNVLDFARGRLGDGLTLTRKPCDLLPVLEEVVTELRSIQPQRIIETAFTLDRPVDCDRSRVSQLVSNLVSNALTHGAADGPVRVGATSQEGVFELSVSNIGEPIAAPALQRLFQPFTRGSVRPSQQGLGLGLYISSQIAIAHGGTLSVSSSPEETCFTFRAPIAC